jgi:hypothetical protein
MDDDRKRMKQLFVPVAILPGRFSGISPAGQIGASNIISTACTLPG